MHSIYVVTNDSDRTGEENTGNATMQIGVSICFSLYHSRWEEYPALHILALHNRQRRPLKTVKFQNVLEITLVVSCRYPGLIKWDM